MKHLRNNQHGNSVLEIIVGLSAFVIITAAVIQIYHSSLTAITVSEQQRNAVILAQESLEQAHAAFRFDWNQTENINSNAAYHFALTDNQWTVTEGVEVTTDYSRSVKIEPVHRLNGKINQSGDVDPNTVLVTSGVSWVHRGDPHTIEIATYVSNW